jgi:5S rRNA maturation endonuclease (ribonuclease M5)
MSINRDFINSKQTLLEKLYDSVDDYDIYNYFFQEAGCTEEDVSVNKGFLYLSPFRDDEKPTVALFTSKITEDVLFTDFALGRTGDVLQFVKLYAEYNSGEILDSMYDKIKYIDEMMELGLLTSSTPRKIKVENRKIPERQKVPLLFKSREFTKRDLDYWEQFNVSEKMLKEHDIRSIQYLLNEKGEVTYEFSRTKLAFALVTLDKVKIYCPESKDYKWRSNVPGSDWKYYQGIYNLKHRNILIITKSYKDVLTFKALSEDLEVDAIAPQSETITLDEEFVKVMKKRYNKIIVVMDFDSAGINAAEKLNNDYGFEIKYVSTDTVNINGKVKCLYKDISDYTVLNGIEAAKLKVKEIIS